MENLRERFRRDGIVRVSETTPQYGGAREKDVQRLVDEGFAAWVVVGESARIRVA